MRQPFVPATALTFLSLASLLAGTAAAQTGPNVLLKPFRTSDQFELNLDAAYDFPTQTSNDRNAAGDNYDYQDQVYNASGRVRLTYGDSTKGLARAQPRAGFQAQYVDIRSDDPGLPVSLFDGSVAVGMGVLAYNGYQGGISLGVGYAAADGDQDANATYLQADFAVGKTYANGDSFGVVLDFNGNRTFLPDWPLPGFQYRKRIASVRTAPDPTTATRPEDADAKDPGVDTYDPKAARSVLVLVLGVPTAGVEWRPTDRFQLNLNYLLPTNFDFRASYQIVGNEVNGAGVYASLSRSVSAYHWNAFPDGDDRLFFRQVRLEGGLQYRLNDRLQVILSGGWAFDQEFSVGFDTRQRDTIADVDATPYARAQLQLRL